MSRAKKKKAEWINKTKMNMTYEYQTTVRITKNEVTSKLKTISEAKGARPDKIQGFWQKSFIKLHEGLTKTLNKYLDGDVPGWLVEEKTKDLTKEK